MSRSYSVTAFMFVLMMFLSSCTPPKPKIRYEITNQTNQRIISIIQLESEDRLFAKADTVGIVNDFDEGDLRIVNKHDEFKSYLKLVVQTNTQRYSTPAFAYKDRCTAYTIDVTVNGLLIEESNFYRYRSRVISLLLIFLFMFSAKGIPLILFARRYMRAIYAPFLLVNSALVITLFVVPSNFTLLPSSALGTYALGTAFLMESISYYWLSPGKRQRSQLIAASILGTILWLMPGQIVALVFRFLFAGC